jgi:predicted DNA-binding transcriptional regulator AlpA
MDSKIRYLTEKQVSEIIGISVKTLRNDRWLGRRLPHSRFGRCVRYRLDDVVRYMESRKVQTND